MRVIKGDTRSQGDSSHGAVTACVGHRMCIARPQDRSLVFGNPKTWNVARALN